MPSAPPMLEAPGVPHEHLRRMRVEPEESERAAHERAEEHGQLAGAGEVEEVEVRGRVGPAEDVGEEREGAAAEIAVSPVASPSRPSARFTPLLVPATMKVTNDHVEQGAKFTTTNLKNGTLVAVAGMMLSGTTGK